MPGVVEHADLLLAGLKRSECVIDGILLYNDIPRLPSLRPLLEDLHPLGDDVLLRTTDEKVAAGKPGAEGIPDNQGIKLLTVLCVESTIVTVRAIHYSHQAIS